VFNGEGTQGQLSAG